MNILVEKILSDNEFILSHSEEINDRSNCDYKYFKVKDEVSDTEIKAWLRAQWQNKKTAIMYPSRKFKAIFFDMDSTAVAQESIVELARFAGPENEKTVAEITEKAMRGECSFDEALRQRVATLKGQPELIIKKAIDSLTINPGLESLATIAKSKEIKLFLISGGFHEMAAHVSGKLAMNDFLANHLARVDGQLSGKLSGPIINAKAKAQFLQDTCRNYKLSLDECISIGDGANDLNMLQCSGLPLGYNPKKTLWNDIDGAIFSNFSAVTALIDR